MMEQGEWEGRRLLVVVAHPDDETFGCGGLIATAAAGGAEVTVCCATRGEAGEVVGGDVPPGRLAAVREHELREAGELLGVRRVVLLDFVDSDMTGDAAPQTLVGAPLDEVVASVRRVLEDVDPDGVVTLDPVAGDGHRDHARIGQATTEAVRQVGSGTSLYYWAVRRRLLERWLRTLAETRPDAGHLDLDAAGLGRPDEDVTTVLDVSGQRQRRAEATAAHRTQRPPHADLPADIADAFLLEDHLVRVEPPWTGGPQERRLVLRER